MTAIQEPCEANANINYATHWALVKKRRDLFRCLWSSEYLNTLQEKLNLKVGDRVTIIDPALLRSSGRWLLGQVIEVHLGKLICVATVKTEVGTYTRLIMKLVLILSVQNLD